MTVIVLKIMSAVHSYPASIPNGTAHNFTPITFPKRQHPFPRIQHIPHKKAQ
jgi:hypothetical protein